MIQVSFGRKAMDIDWSAGTPAVKPYIEEKLSNEVLCCPDRLGAKEAANLEPFYYASAMGC